MNKRILLNDEARKAVQKGINIAADTTCVTLGAMGRNVIISENYVVDYGFQSRPLHISKDGITVIDSIRLSDPVENIGVLLVREASGKTASMAGDGTTSTALLTQVIVNKGMKAIEKGANPVQLKKGIEKGVEYVVQEIKKLAIPVGEDIEKIRQVATVSANNDSSIGDLIAEAYSKIGKDGIINLEDSQSVETTVKITDGFQFDRGWISPYFITDKSKETSELVDPYILLYDRTISQWQSIEPIIIKVKEQNRPLLIICADADGEALAALAMNTAAKRISTCVVKAPLFGDLQREIMEDIAICVGGTYVNDLKGMKLENTALVMLGEAKRVTITKDSTTIIGGAKNQDAQEELLNDLKMNLTQAKGDEARGKIERRIARLTGGVAVISVGAATEVALKEKKDRCDDAVRAVRAAIAEGYLVGAGTAFLRIPAVAHTDETDLAKGYNLVLEVLEEPLRKICQNSGVDPKEIIDLVKNSQGNFGFNAKTEKVEDLLEAGILDPAKVLRCSIENAASAAIMLLTSDALICDVFN